MKKKWFVIHLIGGMDIMRSMRLEKEIDAAIQNGENFILIDISKLNFLSSSSIRILLSTKQKLKVCSGKMKLEGITPNVRKIIELMHLEKELLPKQKPNKDL